MSDNIKKALILFLLITIAGISYYSYTVNKEHIVLEKEMLVEKKNLITELNNLEKQYDDAISKNTLLTDELTVQKESIKNFKDSLKRIKKTNWKLISFYKNKIKGLNVISDKLVRMNDSLVLRNNMLNNENQDLTTQKDSLSSNLQQQTTYNNTLIEQNLNLANKVALGEVVKANNFSVVTYKERSSGKYKETEKARRINVFKTSFVLVENPIAKENNIIAFISIYKPNGDILASKGSFTTKSGERVKYSDTTTIPYKKASIASDILTKFGDVKLQKGTYIVDFYVNNEKVATVKKDLR